MKKVTVTVLQNHVGTAFHKAGEEREMWENDAAALGAKGLVDYKGEVKAKEEGEKLLVSDKKEKVEKNSNGTNKRESTGTHKP